MTEKDVVYPPKMDEPEKKYNSNEWKEVPKRRKRSKLGILAALLFSGACVAGGFIGINKWSGKHPLYPFNECEINKYGITIESATEEEKPVEKPVVVEDLELKTHKTGYEISGTVNETEFSYKVDKLEKSRSLRLGEHGTFLYVRLDDEGLDDSVDEIYQKNAYLSRNALAKPENAERNDLAQKVWDNWINGKLASTIADSDAKWLAGDGKDFATYQDDPLKNYLD